MIDYWKHASVTLNEAFEHLNDGFEHLNDAFEHLNNAVEHLFREEREGRAGTLPLM